MSMPKEKITLAAEQETLMITLYCKTLAAPKGVFSDAEAWKIVDRVDYDFSRLKVKPGTRLTVFMRAKRLDEYVRAFLSRAPDGIVLHLGCGLDTRFFRVDNGTATWFDLDLPDVIELRRKFFSESPQYRMIASSVTDLRWLEQIPRGRPVFVVAEGLLMYLTEEKVKELLLRLRGAFPGCEIAFDAFSTLTARNIKRADVLKTTGASIHWGIDDPQRIETWAPGIRLKEEWTFMQSEDIGKLGAANSLMFKLAGLFPAAAKAHRILYFQLS
jgi:O-methyltransferase involved in polyketide biosynthesis